jgi:hypothetical protein
MIPRMFPRQRLLVFVLSLIQVVVQSFPIKSVPKPPTSRSIINSCDSLCSRVGQPKLRKSSSIKHLPAVSDAESSSMYSTTSTLPTLSVDTTWMIRMTLRNIKTQSGRSISNQMYVINGQFVPQENYEPPQGTFVQQQNSMTGAASTSATATNETTATTTSTGMQIKSSRWILSEDPNDRKDGLWIWGLFQQPLYPFMLLSLETQPIPIVSDGDTEDCIPALQLYVQLDHTCNRDTGMVTFTKRSTADNNYELMVRQKEMIAADPLSLSKVEIYEEVSIGTFSIQSK